MSSQHWILLIHPDIRSWTFQGVAQEKYHILRQTTISWEHQLGLKVKRFCLRKFIQLMYCSKAMFAGHSLMSFSHKPYFIHFCTFIRYYWVILRYINSVGAWNLPLNSAAEICHLSWRTGKSVDGLAKIAFGFVLKTPFLMFFFYLTILIRFGVRSVRNILRQTHGEYGQMAAWFCFIPHSLSDCILSQSHTWCGNWCQPLYWLLFTAVIWIPQIPHKILGTSQ